MLTELRNRGVRDMFVACVDGLTGFGEAIRAIYPFALVQQCVVHQVRNSLAYVSWQQRKKVAAGLREVYTSATEAEALDALGRFEAAWGAKFPMIGKSWRANWSGLSTFFQFPHEIRRAIYTRNAVESLNASLKRLIRHKGLFPNHEAVIKLIYLGLKNVSRKWTMPIQSWKSALNQFAILFEDRFPTPAEISFTQNS